MRLAPRHPQCTAGSRPANLSKLPPEAIELLRLYLKGQLVPAAEAFDVIASLHHGHVEAVLLTMRRLGFASLLASALREPASWCWPWSRLGSLNPRASWRPRAAGTSPRCPPLSGSRTRTPTSCMPRYWLLQRQDRIEQKLADLHNDGLAYTTLSSSYFEGLTGPHRDGKRLRSITAF